MDSTSDKRIAAMRGSLMDTALEAADWPTDCDAQVLLLSGTGSCCLGRHCDGSTVKVGGRGHVIGDQVLRAVLHGLDLEEATLNLD